METLTIELENCHGIKKLAAQFDFTESTAVAVYAPNGSMKTSLAKTFRDIALGQGSSDHIFKERVPKRVVKDQDGNDLSAQDVVVLKSYEDVPPNEKTSTLLVNSELRSTHEKLLKEVSEAKDRLVKALRSVSGSKNIEREVSLTFTPSDTEFVRAISRIRGEIAEQEALPFSTVDFNLLFDQRTLGLLETKDFKKAIEDYVKNYNALLDKSMYFSRGVFNYYNASTIAQQLADNGFFKAKHTVRLNGTMPVEISDVKQLQEIIQAERDSITNDPALKTKYAEIQKGFDKHQDLRSLQGYLSNNEYLLPHLTNIKQLRETVIKSYLKVCNEQVQELLSLADAIGERKEELEAAAAREQTKWQEVIDVFNDRFTVPFKLEVKNLVQVILGEDKMPTLIFTFLDGDETATMDRGQMLETLSTGEQKAFYILNILFDMRVRQESGRRTLFVFDDIADSFDYKNKYAIIEYLRDAAEHPEFRHLILTHNFDFFRTICSRNVIRRKNCLMAVKTRDEVKLVESYGMNNIFNHWKSNFYVNRAIKVATIPFIRNLAEYVLGKESGEYSALTMMLHIKPGSAALTVGDLDAQFNGILSKEGAHEDQGKNLMDFIFEVADECATTAEGVNFEHKIVMSIAIRLAAEKLMIERIGDSAAVEAITGNQTSALQDLFRLRFPKDYSTIALLRHVMLMTPEAIHLNSFMYEPIIDMSDEHLRKLYARVKAA